MIARFRLDGDAERNDFGRDDKKPDLLFLWQILCDGYRLLRMMSLRHSLRALAYRTPAHRWLGLGRLEGYDKAFWDKQLAGEWKPYLGGTISVEARNSLILALIRIYAPHAKSLLDMACASGSLYRTPGGETFDYTGVDISEVAVAEARQQSPNGKFHVSSIQDFTPAHRFDVIIFAEVFHYMTAQAAIAEVQRYAKHGDLIVISMKQDPKSKAVFRDMPLKWASGILYQEKIDGADFKVREDRKRPGYLVGVFRANS